MKQEEIKETFLRTLKGKNIMTPDVIEYLQAGAYIVELSEGTGFSREPIFGVTVLELDGDDVKRRNDLSQLCHSLDDARDVIESLEEYKPLEEEE
jgi:hypothetical protein